MGESFGILGMGNDEDYAIYWYMAKLKLIGSCKWFKLLYNRSVQL